LILRYFGGIISKERFPRKGRQPPECRKQQPADKASQGLYVEAQGLLSAPQGVTVRGAALTILASKGGGILWI